ncbi:MAG: cytochrome P450, partial [Chitinophagaceae bacterium]|nr:cytochrome P450 [Anaerolineae bacterium]
MEMPHLPKGHFVLGNLPAWSRDTLAFMLNIRRYGDLVSAKFGPYPIYFANHPDLFHEIFVANPDHYEKSFATKEVLRPNLGNGLFTSDGEFWKRQRKLMQPAFHTKRIAAYADVMVNYALSLTEKWQTGQTLPIDHEMVNLTMHIVTKSLFDLEMGHNADEVGAAVTRILEIINVRFNRLKRLPEWMPTRENRDLRNAIAKIDALIQQFIDERRRTGRDNGDLLSMMLLAQDDDGSGMTDKQVRDEAMTLFAAGHETTAVALTWTWYLLSQHPEVEAQMLEEMQSVLGGRLPTFADLPNLKYTEMIIKESMRLYPPAWVTSRQVATDDVTLGGYPVDKWVSVVINIFGVHRDGRFFPEPEKFDPERFSPENEKNIHKYAYMPFGAGPRVCIGNAFAMMEAKLVLATIAPRFSLR